MDVEGGDYVGRGCKVTSPNGNSLAFSLLLVICPCHVVNHFFGYCLMPRGVVKLVNMCLPRTLAR